MYRRQQKNISYGVIAFKIIDNIPYYLMVCRKDSFAFSEFIRGKYELEDVDSIYRNLHFMTTQEKNKILNNDFEYLWDNLWVLDKKKIYSGKFKKELIHSKYKFDTLKKGYLTTIHTDLGIKKKKYIKLEEILGEIKKNGLEFEEPEWGFPKGKKNENESDFDCAKREFYEECNISLQNLQFLSVTPIIEKFMADNLQEYIHVYYLAKCNPDIDVTIDKDNYNQISEISNIQWLTYEQASKKIREYNIEKKNILTLVHNYILNTIQLSI